MLAKPHGWCSGAFRKMVTTKHGDVIYSRCAVGAVIEAARGYLMDGSYYTFSHDTPGRANTEAAEFWRHYQIITGEQVENHEATFFTCAC